MNRHLIGDTIRVTWISSGTVPDTIITAVYDGSESLVSSGAMVSSGNGHYYYNYTIPDSGPQFYVAETLSYVDSLPYRRRVRFQVIEGEVD